MAACSDRAAASTSGFKGERHGSRCNNADDGRIRRRNDKRRQNHHRFHGDDQYDFRIENSFDGGKTFDPTHLLDTATNDLLSGIESARSQPAVAKID